MGANRATGTALAAPLVAAAAAMLRKQDSVLADPQPAEGLGRPRSGAEREDVTGGRLNLERALAQAG